MLFYDISFTIFDFFYSIKVLFYSKICKCTVRLKHIYRTNFSCTNSKRSSIPSIFFERSESKAFRKFYHIIFSSSEIKHFYCWNISRIGKGIFHHHYTIKLFIIVIWLVSSKVCCRITNWTFWTNWIF